MSTLSHKEKIAHQINEVASNLTPEYWPHQLFSDEERFILVSPQHYYPNFKTLIAMTDYYLSDMDNANDPINEDCYDSLSTIDNQLVRFNLWLNNNPYIEEDTTITSIGAGMAKRQIKMALQEISKAIYIEIAPLCYSLINNQKSSNEFKGEFCDKMLEIKDKLKELIDQLPKKSNNIEDIINLSNHVFSIILSQQRNEGISVEK